MPTIDSQFPSNFIKAGDLQGQEPVVTIDRVSVEPVGMKKETKPVVYFRGKTKGLVLNKTNAQTIAVLTGSRDTDDWSGHQIRLYATRVDFQGQPVDAIRVKAAGTVAPRRGATPPPADASVDSELGF